jgi:hypothetical protein
MNKKLIFILSLLGLIMGFVTIYPVPAIGVRLFWLAVVIVFPFFIARYCSRKYFLNGLLLGLLNAAWITAAHMLFFNTYIANHQHDAELLSNIAVLFKIPTGSIMIVVLARGIIVGLVSGLILGLFALIASMIMKKK